MSSSESVTSSESGFFDSTEPGAISSATMDHTSSEAATLAPNTESVSFLNTVAEELRNEPCIRDIKDLDTLVKNYVHAQKRMGGMVKIPGETATTDELVEFQTKLGRPVTVEEYEISKVLEGKETLKDFNDVLSNELNAFAKQAHELGLSKSVANKLAEIKVQELESNLIAEKAAAKEQFDNAVVKLKDMWKDEYDERLRHAKDIQQTLEKSYPDEMKNLVASGANRNPLIMHMLSELQKLYSEKPVEAKVEPNVNTVEDARAKLAALKKDLTHPYWHFSHPDHEKASKEVNQWYLDAQG